MQKNSNIPEEHVFDKKKKRLETKGAGALYKMKVKQSELNVICKNYHKITS